MPLKRARRRYPPSQQAAPSAAAAPATPRTPNTAAKTEAPSYLAELRCPAGTDARALRVIDWLHAKNAPVAGGAVVVRLIDALGTEHAVAAPAPGFLQQIRIQAGASCAAGDLLGVVNTCKHPVHFSGLCAVCGANIDEVAGSQHYVPGTTSLLTVNTENAESIEAKMLDRLRKENKLVLILDIDLTLLHATDVQHCPGLDEWYARTKHDPETVFTMDQVVSRHRAVRYVVQLRPGLRAFLQQCSELFEIFIYTMGTRKYAQWVRSVLDPEERIIKQASVLSREDCDTMDTKSLERVMPFDSSMVVILDDRLDVWRNHVRNVIRVLPFSYFRTASEINQSAKEEDDDAKDQTDDQEQDQKDKEQQQQQPGAEGKERPIPDVVIPEALKENHLEVVWEMLRRLHGNYYFANASIDPKLRDIKESLFTIRKGVLADTHIVFSSVFPRTANARNEYIWRTATEFGAKCSETITPKMTHLVAARVGTDKFNEARALPGVHIVSPKWVTASCQNWRRADESKYPVAPGIPTVTPGERQKEAAGGDTKLGDWTKELDDWAGDDDDDDDDDDGDDDDGDKGDQGKGGDANVDGEKNEPVSTKVARKNEQERAKEAIAELEDEIFDPTKKGVKRKQRDDEEDQDEDEGDDKEEDEDDDEEMADVDYGDL